MSDHELLIVVAALFSFLVSPVIWAFTPRVRFLSSKLSPIIEYVSITIVVAVVMWLLVLLAYYFFFRLN